MECKSPAAPETVCVFCIAWAGEEVEEEGGGRTVSG